MDMFKKFKQTLRARLALLQKPEDPARDLLKAIEQADSWENLQKSLVALRTIGRRRQQEVFERLEPLAHQVESLLEQAKAARIKVLRDNLLRQADGYLQQLESEDGAAEVHGASCVLLTNILKQVQRAAAMEEAGVTADMVDAVASRLEEIVETYQTTSEAVQELDAAPSAPIGRVPASVHSIAARLHAVSGAAAEQNIEPVPEPVKSLKNLEARLYEA